MVKKENRLFINQVPVTHYSRTPLRTAPSPCLPTRSPTCVSTAGLGPGHVPSIGLAERASWRSMMIWDRLLPAPPLRQKLGVEGDSGAGGVSPSVARGCAGVGSGKVARWSVRTPTSAVKNSLAAIFPRPAASVFRRGQKHRFCMIRGESQTDQKMADEAGMDTAIGCLSCL